MIDRKIGKIRIRRGTDAQRKSVIPQEGELVYSIDKKRLYIGDDTALGGVSVSNKNYITSSVNDPPNVPYNALYGDIIHQATEHKTYIIGYDTDNTKLKPFLISDPNSINDKEFNVDDLITRLQAVTGCSTPPPPPPPPEKFIKWITQPVDITVGAGETATFTASAEGTGGVSYEWFRVDENTIKTANKANNTLSILDTQITDAVEYYCVASSTVMPSIKSNIVSLIIGTSNYILSDPDGFVIQAEDDTLIEWNA